MELLESSRVRPKQTRSFYEEFQELRGFHFVRMRNPKGAKKAWLLSDWWHKTPASWAGVPGRVICYPIYDLSCQRFS
jgi:hypothetical protein